MGLSVDVAFAEQSIEEVTDSGERARLWALAALFLDWRPLGVHPCFPDLNHLTVRTRNWATGVKVWVDALGHDEAAWCAAFRLVSPNAATLVAAVPDKAGEIGRVYRLPPRPDALSVLFWPYTSVTALVFPDDLSGLLYKDAGESLVLAGPSAFVETALPEGSMQAYQDFRDYAEAEPHAVLRSVLFEVAERHRPPCQGRTGR